MSVIQDALKGLLATSAQQVTQSVVQDPEVKATLAQANAELEQFKKIAWIVGVTGALTFIFYYVPRFKRPFEWPIKTKKKQKRGR